MVNDRYGADLLICWFARGRVD